MAKLTVKQYKDINSKCKNGFVLDLNWFGIWGEKQLRKNIVIDDFTVIDAVVRFGKIYAGRWSDKVAAVQPEIEIKIMTRNDSENSMYHVHDLIEEIRGEQVARRSMKLLFDIEKDFSDDVILAKVREKLEMQPGTYTSIFGADRVETIRNFIAA